MKFCCDFLLSKALLDSLSCCLELKLRLTDFRAGITVDGPLEAGGLVVEIVGTEDRVIGAVLVAVVIHLVGCFHDIVNGIRDIIP